MAANNYRVISIILFLSGMLSLGAANAQQDKPMLDRNKLSIGVGIADNSVGSTDKTGYQFFVDYDLDQVNVMDGVKSSVEVGIADFGFRRDSTGIWGNYVVEGGIATGVSWLGRAGVDIGDDSGLMFGVGVGFDISENADLRIEFVVRDDVDSLQFNLLFGL